mmetsp:Transcript_30840/g.92512  ORF Transcript_30840/g.92512 Transcript_30840/m.92512 type:complete len:217 (-) Transcript_30840:406-1056(-)
MGPSVRFAADVNAAGSCPYREVPPTGRWVESQSAPCAPVRPTTLTCHPSCAHARADSITQFPSPGNFIVSSDAPFCCADGWWAQLSIEIPSVTSTSTRDPADCCAGDSRSRVKSRAADVAVDGRHSRDGSWAWSTSQPYVVNHDIEPTPPTTDPLTTRGLRPLSASAAYAARSAESGSVVSGTRTRAKPPATLRSAKCHISNNVVHWYPSGLPVTG